MVTVKGVHLRKSEDGKNFVSLELSGGIEMIMSQRTGRWYATAKKCFIGSTFSLDQAKLFIGQQMQGNIVRVSCDPYEYTIHDTGEIVTLSHTYVYQPDEPTQVQNGIQPEPSGTFERIASQM